MRIGSPLYLVESESSCWKCNAAQRVIALASPCVDDGGDLDTLDSGPGGELLLLTHVQQLPEPIEQWLSGRESQYRKHFSKNAGIEYFANLCPDCGANFGDHFLHHAGGAFSPLTPEDAGRITLLELPFEGEFEIEADWVMGPGDLLQEFARRRIA